MTTQLDWSAYPGAGGGFQGAVEMCNNNGACRSLAGGVMCPSYRVTRDERDVTRGRANSLRLAITGQLGPDALTSDEMAETLKLCVSCKACRRECPTGVDMARMKIEVQAARAQEVRPVAARPAGRLSAALCALCGEGAVADEPARCACRARRNCRRRIAGFSARRPLPTLARRMCSTEADARRRASARRLPGDGEPRGRAVRRHVQPLFRAREPRCGAGRAATPAAIACMSPSPRTARRVRCAAAARFCRSARWTRRGARRSARSRRWRPTSRAAFRSSAWSRAACSASATRFRRW